MPLLLAVDKVYAKIRNEKYSYIADQMTRFPEEVDQYDPDSIKEIINNCIAHSDYRLRGRINVEEFEDHLVFINEGAFIPEKHRAGIRARLQASLLSECFSVRCYGQYVYDRYKLYGYSNDISDTEG